SWACSIQHSQNRTHTFDTRIPLAFFQIGPHSVLPLCESTVKPVVPPPTTRNRYLDE
ncbi:arylalcohol dehydrogenase, partial [Moniliophthora roreri]